MKQAKGQKHWMWIICLPAFIAWTILIQIVDVQAVGANGTTIGLAGINVWFHRLTGVHMTLYTLTDWLGLVPIIVCLCFGVWGAVQLIRRKSLLRVDGDILLLGAYYVMVLFCYVFFEMVPINYRPILIDGALEASYPSSTTLLVLSVMPTLSFQAQRKCTGTKARTLTRVFVAVFCVFMVGGRLLAGVHWVTDIIGATLLSLGLFSLYRFGVARSDEKRGAVQTEV